MRFPDDVPVLTDGVIRLRAPRLDDVAATVEMNSDPETRRWNAVQVPYRPEDAQQALTERIPAGWRDGGLWTWVIEFDGRYAGAVVLSGGDSGVGSIGFTTHPAARGRDDERGPAHPWWEVPVIETDRFRLRAYRDSDVERTIEFSNDELSLHWLSMIPQPFGRREAERYIASRYEGLASGDRVTWVIADPSTDEMLGDVSVGGLLRDGGGEIGYCAHPAARGRGLVTAAVGRVIEQAFRPLEQGGLGRRRLELVAARGNLASIKVVLSNGFTRTGVRRAADRRRDGSYEDLVTFDLLSGEG